MVRASSGDGITGAAAGVTRDLPGTRHLARHVKSALREACSA
jgi:hypothetical protein